MAGRLFFDIETVGAPESQHAVVRELYDLKAAKAEARGKPLEESFEQYLEQTSLSGEFGRIVCLAYAIDDQPVEVLWGEEKDILTQFWTVAKSVGQFIGHNIYEFDFPFIMKRSRILGVPPTKEISFARYRQHPIYDTMKEWDLWSHGKPSSLHTLARVLDLPTSKDAMDGSEVGAYFAAGRIEEICEYCKKDVALTREVFKRLAFTPDLGAR